MRYPEEAGGQHGSLFLKVSIGSTGSPRELVQKCRMLAPNPDLPDQNLPFNKTSRFPSTLTCERNGMSDKQLICFKVWLS